MKWWQLAVGAGFILVLAAFVAGVMRSSSDPAVMLPPPEAGNPPPATIDPGSTAETWGADHPRVLIGAYLPRGNPTAEYVVQAFRAVTAAYPKTVRAQVINMRQPGATDLMTMHGIRTPLVWVNHKSTFRVIQNGHPVQVSLADGKQLKSVALEKVLRQIVEQELKGRQP